MALDHRACTHIMPRLTAALDPWLLWYPNLPAKYEQEKYQ